MYPVFLRGADSVDPVQIDVHGYSPAGHNHLLKCPALVLVGRTFIWSGIARVDISWGEKQKQGSVKAVSMIFNIFFGPPGC
jgi:hypothetical protein